MQGTRDEAALVANAEDAALWRWFSYLLEERRIRWRFHFGRWLVSVDRVQLGNECTFDCAVRQAKVAAQERGLGLLTAETHRSKAASCEEDGLAIEHDRAFRASHARVSMS